MKAGPLDPEQQLRILGKIWGEARRGYVFLPYVEGKAQDKDERRKSYHEGRAYKWPNDKPAILEHLKAHADDDLYFGVNVFKGKRRIEQNVKAPRVLYADLDPVDPRGMGDLQPTIAWASSPTSYQGVWIMPDEKEGASDAGGLNHRLTAHVGADPSGWDTTQLLRVPGKKNFKFNYREPGDVDGVHGELLWDNGPRYMWEDVADTVPEIGGVTTVNESVLIDEEALDSVDRHDVWSKLRLKVSSRIRQFMSMKDSADLNRDLIEYEIARELADCGATALEIIALIRPTVWNKYKGRSDEISRLKSTAVKALAAKQDKPLEAVEDEEKPSVTWLKDIAYTAIPRPRWLIKNIWTRGGCGFISGAPKSYKSWMALDMAVTVASGGYWLNQEEYRASKAGKVLYLQEEDGLAIVMDRLALINESKSPETFWQGQMTSQRADADGVVTDDLQVFWEGPTEVLPIAMHIHTGFIASDPSWHAWLDEVISEHNFDMVVIDTLGTTMGNVDQNDSSALMGAILKPLKQLAQKHDTAICVVHHNKKAANQGGRAGNDMLGSVALHAWVDNAIYARTKSTDGSIEVERESKLASDIKFRVQIGQMYHDYKTGERALWNPDLILDGLDTVTGPDTAERPKPDGDAAPREGTGGRSLAMKIKQMGRRGVGLETMAEVLDTTQEAILNDLTKAIANGFVEEVAGGRYKSMI